MLNLPWIPPLSILKHRAGISISCSLLFIIKTHLTSPPQHSSALGNISQHRISTSGDIACLTNHASPGQCPSGETKDSVV